jgi:hypothetical protein
MLGLDRGARQQVAQTTTQQGRPQDTALRLVKCIETSPPVYLVKDDHGEILEGTFYAEELQKGH